jgi:hypothetical protein
MTSFKRAVSGVAVAALLASSAAYAVDVTPLPAGKAAGTHEADLLAAPFFWIGLAVVGLGIGLAVSSGGNGHTTPTTTSTTTTTGTTA